jgi:phosphatidate cytidylyltransferase
VGGWPFFACIAVMTVIALHEYYSALPAKNIHPNVRLGVFCSLALLVIAQLSEELRQSVIKMGGASLGLDDLNVVNGALHMTLLVLLVCVAGTLIAQFRMREGQSQVANAATTVFGVVYVGLLFSFALHMRYIDIPSLMGKTADEVWIWDFATRMGALAFIVGPVWLSDSLAFLAGNLWGKIKLAPVISPGKTLEGALGGLLGATIGALIVGTWLGMNPARAIALGVVMGTVGPLGDLGKSVLKRDLGIKDFGTIFGPHGGVLDRFDAILFNMPLIYWYFWFLVMASP